MNFSLEYCLSLEEKVKILEKRCDMQQEIIEEINFLLRYYANNVERKMKEKLKGVWWNGRHGRLKIYSAQVGGGSNPLTPTK